MPELIDRFEIRKILGRGGQGIVYLAHDPRLGRDVAIKTLSAKIGGEVDLLLREARAVSALRHPCIVSLHEAGEFKGEPFLVFEYVTGETLQELIRRNGALPQDSALRIASQVLDGLAHAHKNGVLHRDIKPANIVLEAHGTPRIMDFGAANRQRFNWLNGTNVAVDENFVGTPAYMAPEYIEHRQFSARTDVFAAGLVIAEMLTGKRVFQLHNGNVMKLLQRIVDEPITLPSGPGLDERMVACLLKAIDRDPSRRYDSVLEMKEALERSVSAVPARSAPEGRGTLAFLLRRMKLKKEFPALSQSISEVNRILFSNKGNIAALTNAVLRDFGMTSKIIRLANSGYYHRSATANISTVSGAVYRLGFDTVRNIVISLLMFDDIKDREQATGLMKECARAVLGGAIAKEMGVSLGYSGPEEIFVCAMMHNLGRILSMYYFPEETGEIRKLMSLGEPDEERASRSVLGTSYTELGQAAAKSWGFPAQIIASMDKRAPSHPAPGRAGREERVRLLAGMASGLGAAMLLEGEAADTDRCTAAMREKYRGYVSIGEEALRGLLGQALQGFSEYAEAVGWRFDEGINRRLRALRDAAERGASDDVSPEAMTFVAEPGPSAMLEKTLNSDPRSAPSAPEPARNRVRADFERLSGGIQDMTMAMVEGRSLDDLLRIVVETFYSGCGFDHVLLASREDKAGAMIGRFGLGEDIDRLVGLFRMPLAFVPDVFHAALRRNADVCIADVRGPKIAAHLPDWYRGGFRAGSMVVFPIVVKERPYGLIYADAAEPHSIAIQGAELKLLRALRNQAVLAVRQSALDD